MAKGKPVRRERRRLRESNKECQGTVSVPIDRDERNYTGNGRLVRNFPSALPFDGDSRSLPDRVHAECGHLVTELGLSLGVLRPQHESGPNFQ